MKRNLGKVFVGMSGGVDSSVAAFLLKKQGFDVVGVFMRCYNVDGCAERDAEDARRVAEKIGIPFYVWDFEEEYKRRVVDYMIAGYKAGLTPNPDIECNREIKFGLFLERALKMGADYVATGHYVRLAHSRGTAVLSAPAAESPLPLTASTELSSDQARRRSGSSRSNEPRFSLFEAKDKNKDQSYFLWTLTPKQLRHCIFPIGDYLKPEVREIARKAGLSTAEKKDSQGICFLGKVTLDDFLKEYLPAKRGEVLDIAGKKIGEHQGAHFYTIGQRQGIGNLKHQKGVKLHKPLYVAFKDAKKNTVTVAEEGDENLFTKEVVLTGVNFINPKHSHILPPAHKATDGRGENVRVLEVMARVRYRQHLAKAKLIIKKSKFVLEFEEPQRFVAPGQSAVFYSKEREMIGGGVILK